MERVGTDCGDRRLRGKKKLRPRADPRREGDQSMSRGYENPKKTLRREKKAKAQQKASGKK
jgi:hypothetical protein